MVACVQEAQLSNSLTWVCPQLRVQDTVSLGYTEVSNEPTPGLRPPGLSPQMERPSEKHWLPPIQGYSKNSGAHRQAMLARRQAPGQPGCDLLTQAEDTLPLLI